MIGIRIETPKGLRKIYMELKTEVFNWRYVLVPVAVPLLRTNSGLHYRTIFIFGVRVAYWTVGA